MKALLLAVVGFALLVALPARSGEPAPDDSAEAGKIRAVGKAWMAAYQAGDYDAIPDLYTEDAWIMPRGRPRIVGREQLRKALGGLAAGRDVDIAITERELVVDGDLAWFISDFRVTYGTADDAVPPKTEFGRSLIIYRKGADGRWRVHRDIDSPAPVPAP